MNESKFDIVMDRFNMALPILGLIYLYAYWKKNQRIEDAEDFEYCEMMRSMGKEPSFPHASVNRLKYKMYGRLVANLVGSVIACVLFAYLFWLYSVLFGIATAFVLDIILTTIAIKIWDSRQPSIDEISNADDN